MVCHFIATILILVELATTHMEFSTDTIIRGQHIYMEIWEPVIGECVQSAIEPDNDHDFMQQL